MPEPANSASVALPVPTRASMAINGEKWSSFIIAVKPLSKTNFCVVSAKAGSATKAIRKVQIPIMICAIFFLMS